MKKTVRAYALDILRRQESEGGYLNLMLNHALQTANLSSQDADFLTRLVYLVVSHQLYLDHWINPIIQGKRVRPLEKTVLRMSLCQMLFFDRVPTYAIIDEAVALVKARRGKQAAGFMNALLHQLTEIKCDWVEGKDIDETWSINYSHPIWLVKLLRRQYGDETALKILQTNQKTPSLAARVNRLVTSKEAFLKQYPDCENGRLAQDAVLLKKGFQAYAEAYQRGEITIQDEASQYVSEFLDPPTGLVLDLCSAPGSKTCHLASLMRNQGTIKAFDLYQHKIALVKENAQRLKATNIEAQVYDATQLSQILPDGCADAILLDAPCSGLGVLGRKPEIRYHDSGVLDEVEQLQRQLLSVSYYLLKNNGKMVYSTCTLNKKENEKNIAWFLSQHPQMVLCEQRTIQPFEFGTDGFYMAKMVKKDEEHI